MPTTATTAAAAAAATTTIFLCLRDRGCLLFLAALASATGAGSSFPRDGARGGFFGVDVCFLSFLLLLSSLSFLVDFFSVTAAADEDEDEDADDFAVAAVFD
eukprot:52588_1